MNKIDIDDALETIYDNIGIVRHICDMEDDWVEIDQIYTNLTESERLAERVREALADFVDWLKYMKRECYEAGNGGEEFIYGYTLEKLKELGIKDTRVELKKNGKD